jgi:hypothetical protein
MDEVETTTHDSRRREPTGAYKGENTKRGEGKGHGAVLLITYYEPDTACQRYRIHRIQFIRVSGLKRGGPEALPRVGNIDEGRTVVVWTL